MSIERTYWCEGPDCDIPRDEPVADEDRRPANVSTATPPPYLPPSFIEVRVGEPDGVVVHHFCGWDCVMKYAAKQPIPTVIRLDDEVGEL